VRLFVLYLLALLDGLLCGLRTSMGRSALIRKRSYYVRSAFGGVVGAQITSMLALLALVLTYTLSLRRHELRADLETAAGRMLWIFLPYAALVLFNLALQPAAFNRHPQCDQRFHAWAAYCHPPFHHDSRSPVWNFCQPSP
jgi:hypothetical protein